MKIIFILTSALLLLTCQEESLRKTGCPDEASASGDTIIYYRKPNIDFFSLPSCSGHYDCPAMQGIDIDCDAGKLFATSCSAIPYSLKCVDYCYTPPIVVMISGIRYFNGRHYLGKGKLRKPYYNGVTEYLPRGSQFDTPPQGFPSVTSQGLAINLNTGEIDVDQSVANGIFGQQPQNGSERTFRIYYKLNDSSYYTLNYTDVTFVYESPNTSARQTEASGPGCGSTVIVK